MRSLLVCSFVFFMIGFCHLKSEAQKFKSDSIAYFTRDYFSTLSKIQPGDFDGNGVEDWIHSDASNSSYSPISSNPFQIMLLLNHNMYSDRYSFMTRYMVFPEHPLLSKGPVVLTVPSLSSEHSGVRILAVTGETLLAIQHNGDKHYPWFDVPIDDSETTKTPTVQDDFEIEEFELDLGAFTQIETAALGWFYSPEFSQDLLVVASDGKNQRAFLFSDLEQALQNSILTPIESYPIPTLDSKLFNGPLEVYGKHVLFFQSQNQWILWIPNTDTGFDLAEGSVRRKLEVPEEIIHPVDALFQPGQPYPLMASVETGSDSDVVFAAWLADENGEIDFTAPRFVSLPDRPKSDQPPRLFVSKQHETNIPILILQPPSNVTGTRIFSVYELQNQDELEPVIRQEIEGGNFFESEMDNYSLQRVEQVGDFNGDNISDLLFYMKKPNEELGSYIALFGEINKSNLQFFEAY